MGSEMCIRDSGLGVDVERVVGARVHARLAANAVIVLEVNNAVVGAEQRRSRADRHARGVVALVAAHDVELASHVGKGSRLDVLDPGSIDPERNIVLALAGDRAGMTANAIVAVEKEAESCHPNILGRWRKS